VAFSSARLQREQAREARTRHGALCANESRCYEVAIRARGVAEEVGERRRHSRVARLCGAAYREWGDEVHNER